MDARKSFVICFIGMILLILPICVGAATYKLPVRTATLAVQADHYGEFVNGEPVGNYDFQIDPAVLRVGRDAATNMMYYSYIMFDFQEYSQLPPDATIYYSLYLATAWAPDGVVDYAGSVMPGADTQIPELSDFDWSSQIGETNWSPSSFGVDQTLFDTFGPTIVPSPSGHDYVGWLLMESLSGDLFGQAPIEIAGINNPYGLESPHILVTTVPEPTSLAGLGTALLCLFGQLHTRIRRKHLLGLTLIVALVLCASGLLMADVDSEPGEKLGFSMLAGPSIPPTADIPSGYKYLPTFPRYLWSFGCAPTTGAMIVGYYDNSGFPNLWPGALAPTGGYPHDNGSFLEPEEGDTMQMYPSECDISASDEHVYDYISLNLSGQYWWGNGDDRWYKKTGGFQWYEHTPWNCVADYMGASVYYYRHKGEGSSWTVFQDNLQNTAVLKWKPYTWPYPNVYPNEKLDMTYGLAQYVADYGGVTGVRQARLGMVRTPITM